MTLMTAPPVMETSPRFIPTGNLYVSLPTVSMDDAGVYHVGVLHMADNTSLELVGSETQRQPLLRPVIEYHGTRIPLVPLTWRRDSFWLPHFIARHDRFQIDGTIFAPPGERGFVYLIQVASDCPADTIRIGVEGWWHGVESVAFGAKSAAADLAVWQDAWTGSVVGEARAGLPLLGWGLQPSEDGDLILKDRQYRWMRDVPVGDGQVARIAFYMGVNLESDGARTTALHLRRRGWSSLLAETRRWLDARATMTADPRLSRVLNNNLFFNYFFAQGDCLDSDEMALVTSRSRNYYVSAAFWARDAFLWSFPAMLMVDRERARRALLTGLTRYLRWGGHHALYINGALLYPGFELDEACAPAIALDWYLRTVGDVTFLDQAEVRAALPVLLDTITEQLDPSVGLYRTFLSPHDDPVMRPFLAYDNVLVWRVLCILAGVYARIGATSRVVDLNTRATSLREAILTKCVVDGPFGPQFAWAIDEAGGFELGDQPGGSLTLLTHYGFCGPDDPVYRNTVRWIYSSHNPYLFDGPFGGAGSAHFQFPCIFDLANRLLRRDATALDLARRAPLDQGLACESFDPQTGIVRTGAAFASAAGLLAFAVHEFVRRGQIGADTLSG